MTAGATFIANIIKGTWVKGSDKSLLNTRKKEGKAYIPGDDQSHNPIWLANADVEEIGVVET